MGKVFYNLTWKEKQPSIEEVCKKYSFKPEDVDVKFGVIALDPAVNLYTILVEEAAVQRIDNQASTGKQDLKGPYSNPRIEPFGLEEDSPKTDKPNA